jgi:hypothetical protein
MSKLAVSVLILVLASTSLWAQDRNPQSVDLDAIIAEYESPDCCWDRVDFDRPISPESDLVSAPVCCWVLVWEE